MRVRGNIGFSFRRCLSLALEDCLRLHFTPPLPEAPLPVQDIAHYNFRLERSLMEEVRAFYEDVVGLRAGPRPAFNSLGYWLYAGAKDVLHLTEEKPEDPRQRGSNLTFDHVALQSTNWPEFQRRLELRQVPYMEDRPPGTSSRQVFFRDPAGNGVELLFQIED